MELDTFRIDFHERHPDKDTPPHSPTETYVPSSDEEYISSSDEEYYYPEEAIERNELNPKVKEFIVYDNSFCCMCLLDFISYTINICYVNTKSIIFCSARTRSVIKHVVSSKS